MLEQTAVSGSDRGVKEEVAATLSIAGPSPSRDPSPDHTPNRGVKEE